MNFTTATMKFFLLAIYLILMNCCLVLCQSDECPPPEDIYPCTCSEAEVVCVGILNDEELNQVANNSTDWKFPIFVIENSTFHYIPSNIIVKKKVNQLHVYDSVLTSLFERPVPANSKLERVFLHNVVLTSGLKWEHFSKIHTLKEFLFYFGEVKKVDQSFIDNMPQGLEKIDLVETKTTQLDPFAFADLPELYRFYLKGNNIESIKRSMFAPESKLEQFGISHCNLSYLPDDMFRNMNKLHFLELSGTNIVVLEAAVFGDILPHLRAIYLEDNDIDCNCQMKWVTTVTKPPSTTVKCQRPRALKGLSIKDLKPKHFSHC